MSTQVLRLKMISIFICVFLPVTAVGSIVSHVDAISQTSTSDLPYDIHLNWQHDTSTTMTIVWETTTATTGTTVQYGLDSSYGHTATGTTDNQGTNGLIHIVEITGLPPATTFHYKCGDATGGWSKDYTFATSPTTATNFHFCAMGDSRDNPTEFKKIVNDANGTNPAFTIFSGDLCGSDDPNDYDVWFSNWEQLGDHCPIMPAIGNHEEGGSINYLHRFALPNNERWYSLNYSNIHIISLSTSEDSYAPGSNQYTWLVNDLKAAANDTSHPWKIAFFHNPPYNVGGHGGDTGVQNYLVPLFLQYKVDLVINGHNHYYERTYSLNGSGPNPTVTDNSLHYYKNPVGVIYATCGSCGAPLYDPGTAYYLAVSVKNYNYANIHVYTNSSLHMEVYLDDGSTKIDDFWIEKSSAPPANQPPTTPSIKGPAKAPVKTPTTYNFTSSDPEGSNVSYFINWGDGTNSSWIGPYPSGEGITQLHTWSKKGVYTINAKARDVNGSESTWGTLKITMPYTPPHFPFLSWLLGRFPHVFPILRLILTSH